MPVTGNSRRTRSRRALAGTALLLAVGIAALAPRPGDEPAGAATATAAGGGNIVTKKFRMSRPDEKRRLVVRCPGNQVPYGGGMVSSPAPGAGGEGAYPHSYERLGVQRGWHVTAVLYDPTHRSTEPRRVTLQVACGPKRGHVTPPHTTTYVKPGQTKTVVATCPGRRHLFGGGFQRTDFISRGGNYVIESRAISSKSWRVVARAFGDFGGEITAIAYCLRSRRPMLKEVSATTPLASGTLGKVTTPSCPKGRRLVGGGFKGPDHAFLTDGRFNRNGSWSASGFNKGAAGALTAYGYCLR